VLNQVQLSVYPDGIGDNLSDLKTFLSKHIDGMSAHWLLRAWLQRVILTVVRTCRCLYKHSRWHGLLLVMQWVV
jgi:hypothetical protein